MPDHRLSCQSEVPTLIGHDFGRKQRIECFSTHLRLLLRV